MEFSCIFVNFQHAAALKTCLEEILYECQYTLLHITNSQQVGALNKYTKKYIRSALYVFLLDI